MHATHRALASIVCAAALLAAAAAEAHGRRGGHGGGYYPGHHAGGHGHWGPGRHRGGVSIGIGLGLGSGYYYGAPYYYQPGYVVTVPPPLVYAEPQTLPAEPVAKGLPDPIFYPRNGQSVEQTEADRQDCNRWAIDQPGAIARADVFQRATLACMEGRGYTVR